MDVAFVPLNAGQKQLIVVVVEHNPRDAQEKRDMALLGLVHNSLDERKTVVVEIVSPREVGYLGIQRKMAALW